MIHQLKSSNIIRFRKFVFFWESKINDQSLWFGIKRYDKHLLAKWVSVGTKEHKSAWKQRIWYFKITNVGVFWSFTWNDHHDLLINPSEDAGTSPTLPTLVDSLDSELHLGTLVDMGWRAMFAMHPHLTTPWFFRSLFSTWRHGAV